MRTKFEKGKQREFLNSVLEKTNCPSLRELSRRFDLNYSTLKNYFTEARFLPQELFRKLCDVSGLNPKVNFVENNWGQVLGGKKKKARKLLF